eukprot:870497-Rhodomonas_salina.1
MSCISGAKCQYGIAKAGLRSGRAVQTQRGGIKSEACGSRFVLYCSCDVMSLIWAGTCGVAAPCTLSPRLLVPFAVGGNVLLRSTEQVVPPYHAHAPQQYQQQER